MRPIPVGGTPSAFNSDGEVLVTNPARVWDRNGGTAEALPTLSNNCFTQARNLNDAGIVVGKSQIKVKGRCTDHAVIWTKNDP